MALVALVTYLLVRSPWGRVLKSIRENEDAARSLGKNVYGYKMQALMIGGVIGALGGILGAIGDQSVQPDNFVDPDHVHRLRLSHPGWRGAGRRARSWVASSSTWCSGSSMCSSTRAGGRTTRCPTAS